MEFDFTSLAFGGEQHIVAWDSKRIGLQTPVTDIHRLRTTDQRLYLYMYRQSSKTVVLGGLKVGTKRLYVRTISAELREIEPICVLDFYVHESCQRQGIGRALFEHFLNTEGLDPSCLAYDRPSPKLLAFLRKHYDLQDYVPQSNNYVVFNRYFELNPPATGSSRGGQAGRLDSRGSVGTPSIHPLHGPRSTPPRPQVGIHPDWAGVAATPSAVALPQPLGNSPSFGRRWAANNFGSSQSPDGPAVAPHGGSDGKPSLGDSLDAFSRAHGTSGQQPPYPGRQPAPWGESAPGPSMAAAAGGPPASRGGYSSRPPWAVDDSPPGGSGSTGGAGGSASYAAAVARTPQPMERIGTGASTAAARGPLQTILTGGGGSRDGGGGGPHTRALQQQVAALQLAEGPGGAYGQAPPPSAPQQPWAASGPGEGTGGRAVGSAAEDAGGAGRAAARIMAVAQRSGAGAADCLVW